MNNYHIIYFGHFYTETKLYVYGTDNEHAVYFSQVMMQDDAAHPLTQGYLCSDGHNNYGDNIDYHHARRYTTTHSTHHTPHTYTLH